jgi:thioredoxin 1
MKRVLITAGQVYGPLDTNKLVGNRVRGIWAAKFADHLADQGYEVTFLVPDVNSTGSTGGHPLALHTKTPAWIDRPMVTLTAESFSSEVLQSPLPVLVDFWAPWCAPCKVMAPQIDQLAAAYEGRLKVAKLDVQDHPTVASDYGVSSIPTLLVFSGGVIVARKTGAGGGPAGLRTLVEPHLSPATS